MRKLSEIYNLPVSELTDEEIIKATMKRLGTKMCALVYRGDEGQTEVLWRFKDKEGKEYWNKIETNTLLLWQKLTLKVKDRYWRKTKTKITT